MATCACPDCLEERHEHCSCLDCHAKLYAAHGSCSCSLCADRYRSEVRAALTPVRSIFAMMTPPPTAPTPRKAGDIRQEPAPAVESVAAGDEVR